MIFTNGRKVPITKPATTITAPIFVGKESEFDSGVFIVRGLWDGCGLFLRTCMGSRTLGPGCRIVTRRRERPYDVERLANWVCVPHCGMKQL